MSTLRTNLSLYVSDTFVLVFVFSAKEPCTLEALQLKGGRYMGVCVSEKQKNERSQRETGNRYHDSENKKAALLVIIIKL